MKDASSMMRRLSRRQAPGPALPSAQWFVLSAGAILTLSGMDNVLAIFRNIQPLSLEDPIFELRFLYLLPLLGLAKLFVAWFCLFTTKRALSTGLITWLVLNLIAYRAGLWAMGWPHPWVLVGGLTGALNISPILADAILLQIALYLLAGSIISFFHFQKQTLTAVPAPVYFKVRCQECGGKTAFDTQWVGQVIPCPHCGKTLHLTEPARI